MEGTTETKFGTRVAYEARMMPERQIRSLLQRKCTILHSMMKNMMCVTETGEVQQANNERRHSTLM